MGEAKRSASGASQRNGDNVQDSAVVEEHGHNLRSRSLLLALPFGLYRLKHAGLPNSTGMAKYTQGNTDIAYTTSTTPTDA